ncbi:MAG: hypothetical protein J6N49_00365 [Alphaproteobacteria bacterium]|nr:hypothetical protein [Alphaproteobacteria bacterium]
MSEEDIETPKTEQSALQSVQNTINYAKNKQTKEAAKEVYSLCKNLYIKYLKGQYVEVKGKKIPRTAIFITAVVLLFLILPGGSDNERALPPASASSQEKAAQVSNLYDKDGIKVYDLVKCEQAACGLLENGTQKSFEKITINMDFHDAKGNVIYSGGIDASEVGAMSRIKIKIPCEIDFSYFELKEVELMEKQPE